MALDSGLDTRAGHVQALQAGAIQVDADPARPASARSGAGRSGIGLSENREGIDSTPEALSAATPVNAWSALKSWFSRQQPARFFSANLLRRILLSNLAGLALLLLGILYLTQYHTWLIGAKQEALKTQGRIIAAAIAGNAKVTRQEIDIDPTKLPEAEGSLIPFRDDGFAALELSIRPEQVSPILRKLTQDTQVRARIYGRDGSLIVDSARFLAPGQISKSDNATVADGKPKDFWTRLTQWLIDKDLPVYKEIGSGKGTAYKEVAAALKGAAPTPMLLLNDEGDQIVAVPVPIQRAKAVHGVLLLSTRPGEIDDILYEQRKVILWLAAMALAAAIVSSVLLDRTVAGPMRKLSDTAMAVSRNINQRHELPDYAEREDEVGQMARAFRSMTTALYRRIEASEKFAADVAHELKNPLTAARSTAESLTYAKTDAQRQELVDQIQIELKRLNRLITDVSKASRLDAELARQRTGPVALIDVIESVVDVMAERARGRGCNVNMRIDGATHASSFVIDGNDGRIAQVLTNLVDNALSFSSEGGVVEVIATRTDTTVEIAVEDQGPGIEEDKLSKIFERFYTYRPTANTSRGDNSGLGLSISREIVHAHGGEIRAENRYRDGNSARGAADRLGARFVVTLPAGRIPIAARGGHGLGWRG